MDRAEALTKVASARSAHLATIRPDAGPHVVPITFALDGDEIVTIIDDKPKSTRNLQRLINIEVNPTVSVLADQYTEDWDGLWWVRIDGTATIHQGDSRWTTALGALTAKYAQYARRPPGGPVIAIGIERVTYWESTP